MRRTLSLFLSFGFTLAFAQVKIDPSNDQILYTGRVEFTNPLAPVISLNGASIEVNFEGTEISGEFSSSTKTYLYVIVDGNDSPYERTVIEIAGSKERVMLAAGLSEGNHHIKLVKLDEGSLMTFFGFELEGQGILPPPERSSLKLEFIGDSNAAGWNAWNAYDNGGNEVSGAYHTYPGIVSRMLGAEYSLIGASGSGITNKASWNCRDVWDRIHPYHPESENNSWNFEDNYWNFSPDAVVINLGANDLYGSASKQEIKTSWKAFITSQLRPVYPAAHIVLVNSYGWAIDEPADYVDEAINELVSDGDANVSYVRLPWLWGQEHAVINEHAGFANLIANHLANVLELPEPDFSELSSFVLPGRITNGSFEASVLSGMADGWRPRGTIELKENEQEAIDGLKFMRVINGGRVHFATEVEEGTTLSLEVWGKANNDAHTGSIRIEFKDQAQRTLNSKQIEPDFRPTWGKYNLQVKVPANVWSAWIVLSSDDNSVIDYDQVNLGSSTVLGLNSERNDIRLYPNPVQDTLRIDLDTNETVAIYDGTGSMKMKLTGSFMLDISQWDSGLYYVKSEESGTSLKFLKN